MTAPSPRSDTSQVSQEAEKVRDVATANPSDDINRIIIGLGGQGSRVVDEVRKAVLSQGPLPSGLDFVAVDSDRLSLTALDSVPEDHRIHLPAPDDTITETLVPWLPHEFRPKAGGGCGMQRLTGKAMYLVHRQRILETVRAVARGLRQRTQSSNFMIVLVNAFGGGTGSGMAIDFSLDVRGDIKEITGQDPVMFGVGILPARSETIQRANGVAMIKELHLLLSNKEPVVVGGRDHSNPFELFFLVGREVMGIERDEDVLSSIVSFTIDLGLIPSAGRDHAANGKGAGWVDLQDIRTLVKGASHSFSTFGCYRAVFPVETLLQYFEALDRIASIRNDMPSFVTDIETERQSLEDKKIALAHAEEVLERARARAAKLRSDGILGANRPELAKLLEDIGRLEDEVRKARRELAAAEKDVPQLGEKRESLETELREWETHAEQLLETLVAPTQSQSNYVVPLTKEECEYLVANRHLVEEGHFRSVMDALGRMPDYNDKTMEVVGKNKILYLPLLNYRLAFHTAAAFPPRVLAALRKHGFVRFDSGGNPVVSDDHLWMVMAMLATNPDNVDASKVSARAFKDVVEGHIARRAEVKIVPSKGKRFEVVIHSWMVGVQVSPVAPGYPPRLRELEWLMPEYEQLAREGGLTQHHAFLYGDPLAFSELASVPVDRTSMTDTNTQVTEFWSGYAPIDAPARWMQLPPLLAETVVATEDLSRAAGAIVDELDAFRRSAANPVAIDRLGAALDQGTEGVEAFVRAWAEDADPLRDRLDGLANGLERARVGPRDPGTLVSMEELAGDALKIADTASTVLAQLGSDLPDAVGPALASAQDAHDDQREPRGRARRDVRREHLALQTETRAARLQEAISGSLDQLEGLQRTLEHVQETLRARSVGHYARKARLAAPPLTVEMRAGRSGNGHHGGPERHPDPSRAGERPHDDHDATQEDME